MNSLSHSPLSQYRCVGAYGSVETADPHRLVALLYDGLGQALGAARLAIERRDLPAKGREIGKAAGILDSLRASLNMDQGGDMAENLDRLYEYMGRQITQANLHDDLAAIDSVTVVNETLRGAWAQIPDDVRRDTIAA